MKRSLRKHLLLFPAISLVLITVSAVILTRVSDWGEALVAALGLTPLHPAVVIIGAGLVLVSLIILISAAIGSPPRRHPEYNDPTLDYNPPQMNSGVPLDPESLPGEIRFALDAAFEKLRQSRLELEQEIETRTQQAAAAYETTADLVASSPSAWFVYQFKAPDRLTLVDANPAAGKLVGGEPDALVGREFADVWPAAHRHDMQQQLLDVLQTGETYETEYTAYGDAGLERAFRVEAFILPGERLAIVFHDITADRTTADDLKKDRDRLHTYLDIAGCLLVALDTDCRITQINAAARGLLGQSADELIGQDWITAAVPETKRGKTATTFEYLLSGRLNPNHPIEHIIRTHGGEDRIVSWRVSCVTDALGQIVALFLAGEDVTDRRMAEQAISENEQRLQAILDTIQTGLMIIDPNTELIVDANLIAAEIFGYTREELIGRAYARCLTAGPDQPTDDDADSHRQRLMTLLTADGQKIPVLRTTAPVKLGGRNYRLENFIDIARRIEAEKTLRESEEQYRRLVDNAKEVIFVAQDGMLAFFNPQTVEMTKYPAEELAGMPFSKLIHPEDRRMVLENHQRRIAGEDVEPVYSFRVTDAKGEVRWAEIHSMPITWQERPATLNFVTDISDRRAFEADLRRHREAMEASMDGMAILDADGIYSYVNQAHAKIYGYDCPDDLIGKSWHVLYDEAELERFTTEIMPRFERDGFWHGEATGRRGDDGRPFPQEVSLTAIDGGGLICVVRDVTERKTAEQAVQDSEQRFRSLVESVPNIAVQGYNRERKIIFWNQASELLYGYTSEEALGKSIEELLLPPAESDEGMPDGGLPGEHSMKHKQGFTVPVYSSHVMLTNGRGEIEMYCLDVDLTELKVAQDQQRILRKKLDRAERMESLGVLAGGVAHDLNNMLGPLVGYSDLILMRMEEDNPLRKQVQRIGKSAKDAADVIQDLLTLARRGRYQMEPTNINDVISSYLDTPAYETLAQERPEIDVRISLDSSLPGIMGSAPHLSKVFMNLVVNAYDAMPDGGTLTVDSSCRQIDTLLGGFDKIVPGEYIIIRVADTGTGISPEDIGRIFEPYYSKKNMGHSGSGLGLAVVYGIVKDHKGYYDVFSTEGDGAEFVMYFPVTRKRKSSEDPTEADYRGSETILVVDDIAEQREIMSDMLTSLGYQVATVSDGREAVLYVSNNDVDLVVMDMILQKNYDGCDSYRDMHASRPGQKAIVVSGFSATERVAEMQKLGAGPYLRKPFTLEGLGRAIRQELDTERPVVRA